MNFFHYILLCYNSLIKDEIIYLKNKIKIVRSCILLYNYIYFTKKYFNCLKYSNFFSFFLLQKFKI